MRVKFNVCLYVFAYSYLFLYSVIGVLNVKFFSLFLKPLRIYLNVVLVYVGYSLKISFCYSHYESRR